jgi:hypothetical protein
MPQTQSQTRLIPVPDSLRELGLRVDWGEIVIKVAYSKKGDFDSGGSVKI